MALPLEGSLRGLREALFYRLDLAPNASSDMVAAANNVLNQAVQQIALEVPHSVNQGTIRFRTEIGYTPTLSTDQIAPIVVTDDDAGIIDQQSFRRTVNVYSTIGFDGTDLWPIDRSWDGVAWVEFTDSAGFKHYHRIRCVWQETPVEGETYQYFSIFDAWNPLYERETSSLAADTGPFDYRIFIPHYWIPDNVVQIHSMRIVGNGETPIRILSQDEAERMSIVDFSSMSATGIPRYAYRREHFALQTPTTAASVMLSDAAFAAGLLPGSRPWEGPEPYGSWDIAFTRCMGKRSTMAPGRSTYDERSFGQAYVEGMTYNDDLSSSDETELWGISRRAEPMFESGPSPVSEVITVADPDSASAGQSAVYLFPNYEYQLGYLMNVDTGVLTLYKRSDTRSGEWIRIYKRRLSTDIGAGYAALGDAVTGARATALNRSTSIELSNKFYLLAEFKPDENNKAVFVDSGTLIPDFSRPLRDVHGYQAFSLYPLPDTFYTVELRVTQRPQMLIDDTDVPPLDPVACKAVVDLAASMLYERMKDPFNADRSLRLYQAAVATINRRYGDLRPPSQPARRIPANMKNRRLFRTFRSGNE